MSVFCLLYIDWSCCGNSFATTVIPSVDSFGPPCCFSDMPLNLCSVECFANFSGFYCRLLLSPLESLLYTFLILNPTLPLSAFCLVGLTLKALACFVSLCDWSFSALLQKKFVALREDFFFFFIFFFLLSLVCCRKEKMALRLTCSAGV